MIAKQLHHVNTRSRRQSDSTPSLIRLPLGVYLIPGDGSPMRAGALADAQMGDAILSFGRDGVAVHRVTSVRTEEPDR